MSAHLRARLRRRSDRGASAIEYGLMVAAIAAAIVGVVFVLGGVVQGAFQKTCETIAASPAGDGGSCPQPGGGTTTGGTTTGGDTTGGDATGGDQQPVP